jgi:hypothetical protein
LKCPQCTNIQVENCLLSTAKDVGSDGKDDQYGYGIVQAESAYICLANEEQCCDQSVEVGGELTSTQTVSETSPPAPSAAPAPSPAESWSVAKEMTVAASFKSTCLVLSHLFLTIPTFFLPRFTEDEERDFCGVSVQNRRPYKNQIR